jgi:AcrR family transcriptional regulator
VCEETTVGTTERRERERMALRERILNEGREILTSDGYEALTMRKLADRIEYTPGALYAHFPDKDAIVRAVCEHDFRAFSAHMADAIDVKDPIDRLRSLARAYARFALERQEPYKLLFVARPLVNDLSSLHENPETDAYTLVLAAVNYAIEKGHFKAWRDDAHLIAQTLWAGMHGAVMIEIWRTPEKPMPFEPIERRLEAICETLIHGLRSAAPPPRGARKRPASPAAPDKLATNKVARKSSESASKPRKLGRKPTQRDATT